jgi:uncharacterized DUF497 family protein
MTYGYEDWVELDCLIEHMGNHIFHEDIYELEKHEFEKFQKARDFIKTALKIHTGAKLVYSEVSKTYYIANMWYHHRETDLIVAISKREATEEEVKKYASANLKRTTSQIRD